MRLKVLSWNIHKGIGGLDRRYRLDRVADVIGEAAPDLALLQEVADGWPPAGGELQGQELAAVTGLEHLAFAPEHRFATGGYGNAILSRFPIVERHRIDLKIGWRKQRSALQAQILLPSADERRQTIVATSLHLGLAEGERRQQLQRLLDHDGLASRGAPSVLGGDFNDVFGTLGRRFPQRYQRAGSRELSFPAFAPVFCLDGIYVKGFDIVSAGLFRGSHARFASDHLPLVAEVELSGSS